MKFLHAFFSALFCVSLLMVPGRAQDLGETVSAPGVFSYQAPKGWVVKDASISRYKVCVGPPKNNFAPNINVVVQTVAKPLADYVELNKTQLQSTPLFQNLQILDEKPFATSGGVQGTRVVVKDTLGKLNLQQIFYFFAGSGDTKIVVTASSLVDDGDQYAPVFDASMKTFSPN